MSKIVLNNPENFPIKTLNRFKDIAVFVVGSFLLPHPVECGQLTCQFPTWRSPVLCSYDRGNSMYEQQTWMLTIGLQNRNTGCQCSSIRLQLPTSLVFIGCLLSDPSPLPKWRNICRPISGYMWFPIVIRSNDRAILYRYRDMAW